MKHCGAFCAVALALAPSLGSAQQPAASPSRVVTARGGTTMGLEVTQSISSRTSKPGDRFTFRLAEPLTVDGETVVPAGTTGEGEVVHSARSGVGGKAGELILVARFINIDGQKVPLRGFQLMKQGRDNTGVSLALGMAVGVGFFVTGGEIVIPEGTMATAKLSADISTGQPSPRTLPTASSSQTE